MMTTARSSSALESRCRVIPVFALAALLACPPLSAQQTGVTAEPTKAGETAQPEETWAFSLGFTTPISDQSVNPITWAVGFRLDPGQSRTSGPSFGASVSPALLGEGFALILVDAGYGLRIQGDHMALLPRASVGSLIAIGGEGFGSTGGFGLGVGVELRSKGSPTGVRLDWSVWGVRDTPMLLGLQFTF